MFRWYFLKPCPELTACKKQKRYLPFCLISMNPKKILQKILSGSRNIRFSDMTHLVQGYGFTLSRTDGSHHIFSRSGIPELVNLQNVNGQAKPYQIRQFLKFIEKYNLRLEEKE